MLSKATEDASLRTEKIAKFSGGTFHTGSKHKTASITIKLVYKAN